MPPTSCPDYRVISYIPIAFVANDPSDRDDLQRKFYDARKHRISSKWSFTEVIQKFSIDPHPNARPIPSFALDGGQFRFQPVWAPQPASFSGTESFQTSQVWVANVFKVDGGVTGRQSQPERVVLKILQPSMRPFPNMKGIRPVSPAYQLAYSEEILYERLQPLQGSHVPYYFGTFQVTLPNGEEAYILILEYIEDEVLEKWVKKYETTQTRPQDVLPVTIKSIIDAFRAIHAARVAHTDMDLDLSNIIRRKDGTVVIIDFADCALLDTPEKTETLVRAMSRGCDNQGYRCVRTLLSYCLSNSSGRTRTELEEWIHTPGNVPSEIHYPYGPPRVLSPDQIDASEDDDDEDIVYRSDMSDTDSGDD